MKTLVECANNALFESYSPQQAIETIAGAFVTSYGALMISTWDEYQRISLENHGGSTIKLIAREFEKIMVSKRIKYEVDGTGYNNFKINFPDYDMGLTFRGRVDDVGVWCVGGNKGELFKAIDKLYVERTSKRASMRSGRKNSLSSLAKALHDAFDELEPSLSKYNGIIIDPKHGRQISKVLDKFRDILKEAGINFHESPMSRKRTMFAFPDIDVRIIYEKSQWGNGEIYLMFQGNKEEDLQKCILSLYNYKVETYS